MLKNERLKQGIIDKIALFLNNKYNKVFKDKNFSMSELKYEISKLLNGKNMKQFKFNESIKKIEKSILKTVSNNRMIKYKPVEMNKINTLLSFRNQENIQENTKKRKSTKLTSNLEEESKNQECKENKRIQSAIPKESNLKINIKQNSDEFPYPTEKVERLREREKNKWAIQANKEYEEYLKEQNKIKKDNYEKKLKQKEILEAQIKEKKEYMQKMKQEEMNFGPSFTSLKFEESKDNKEINKEVQKIRRPLSSKPCIQRRKEEIEYQRKIEEDLKRYKEEEDIKKKKLRDKYKEIQKENYENALKKRKEKLLEKKENENNDNICEYIFNKEDIKKKEEINKKQKNKDEFNKIKINQNIKHQIAINNYENQKYKKEIEQEEKKYVNEKLIQNEKKKKMLTEYKKGLDEQIREKQKIKELYCKEKINENKDNLNINNQIIEENILKKKEKYERINNYKKDLDEQIEKNKKYKINEEF